MDLSRVTAGRNPPKEIHAFIEIPFGGVPVKYELDKNSGALYVDRFLHTAMYYPGNYGFIPHTLSRDGDPCDVLVVAPVPLVPGAVVRCRPVGALLMEDQAGPDEKVLAVPVDDLNPFYHDVSSYRTCRRSYEIKSPTSSRTTRTWKKTSGATSANGLMSMDRRG